MRTSNLFIYGPVVAATVAALSACGGGGGGGDSVTSAPTTTISGIASKGLLQNARVTAYCGVQSSNNVLATGTTGATDGDYTLSYTSTCALPVELVVSSVPGSTKILDETAGSIDAPADLSLRAFVPTTGTATSQHITPFTDMAAALVENSVSPSTPLSASVVGNANAAIVTHVLGGNAGLLLAKPVNPADYDSADSDQKKLLVLLAGISQAAASDTGSDSSGAKVQKILKKLSTQAKQTIPTVSSTGYSVSATADTADTASDANATPLATIKAGLTTLSSKSPTAGSAQSKIKADIAGVQTSVIGTATTQLNAQKGKTVDAQPPAAQSAIALATKLLVAVRTNLLALVNPREEGFLQVQARALSADMDSQSLGGTYQFTDIMLAAHRATSLLARTNKAVEVAGTGTVIAPAHTELKTNAFGKTVRQAWTEGDSETKCEAYYAYKPNQTLPLTGTVAPTSRTSPLDGNNGKPVAVCNKYVFSGNNLRMMQMIVKSPDTKPTTGVQTFSYTNRVRTWADANCTSASDETCGYTDSDTVTGQFTATLDADQAVTAMTMDKQPVIALQKGVPATLSLNYAASVVDKVNTVAFTGGLSSGALSYRFTEGSKLTVTDTSTATTDSGTMVAKLVGSIRTGKFAYAGTFDLDGSTTGNADPVGKLSLVGSVASVSDGKDTPFLDGTLTGNSITRTAAFSGKVTQSGKENSISLTSATPADGTQTATVTVLTPGYSFSAQGTSYDDPTKTSTMKVTASDGTVIDVSRVNGGSSVKIKSATGAVIGTLDGNQVNFIDGSYLVLN